MTAPLILRDLLDVSRAMAEVHALRAAGRADSADRLEQRIRAAWAETQRKRRGAALARRRRAA